MKDRCLVFRINFIQLQKESNSLSSSSVKLPLVKEIKFYDKRVYPLSLSPCEWESEYKNKTEKEGSGVLGEL